MNTWLAGLAVLAVALSAPAHAQNKPPDPADPKAAAAPLRYESAFVGYRGASEEKPAPWKEVNDAVKVSGGHAAHGGSKSTGPQPSRPSPPVQPSQPASTPGHRH